MPQLSDKGKIVPTEHGHIALLRVVCNSRFVSGNQLFWLLNYAAPMKRSTYYFHIERLVTWRYIHTLPGICWKGFAVYSITHAGLLELESRGEFNFVVQLGRRQPPKLTRVYHALELNEIHLALLRSSLLAGWDSRIEIPTANAVLARFKQEYSAVVRVRSGDQVREFALVYERSLTAAKRYKAIRESLKTERDAAVLYLTTSPHLVFALLCRLTPNPSHLAFATARQFCRTLLATPVLTETTAVTLEDFLTMSST